MDPDIDKLKDRAKYMVCIYMYRYGFEEMLPYSEELLEPAWKPKLKVKEH